MLFRLQNFINEQQEIDKANEVSTTLSRFKIVPLTSFKRRHIMYDNRGLYDLLVKCNLRPTNPRTDRLYARPEFHDDKSAQERAWQTLFDERRVTSRNERRQFNETISTDGVAVSFHYMKLVGRQTQLERLDAIKKKFKAKANGKANANGKGETKGKGKATSYERLLAFDPGKKLTMAGVAVDVATGHERNLRLKSGTYYQMIKHEARKREQLALGVEVQRDMIS